MGRKAAKGDSGHAGDIPNARTHTAFSMCSTTDRACPRSARPAGKCLHNGVVDFGRACCPHLRHIGCEWQLCRVQTNAGVGKNNRTGFFEALSPFNYKQNCLLYIPRDIPSLNSKKNAEMLAQCMEELVNCSILIAAVQCGETRFCISLQYLSL
jgi:hypothetical protein